MLLGQLQVPFRQLSILDGQTLDFMLSEKRDTKSAKKFFANALCVNGIPKRITIDKSSSDTCGDRDRQLDTEGPA
ncbi:hypothetical protein RUE5091_01919 [Ruegeria denitrificans]|uniref:DDE domain-containing protein n=1 Tax=Ruegeria denitrificans TaxID=1715692 RepID=A0A0P1I8Q5_9RHOB|nr:DDE-type integrase/transposase/recombinase [Ruegeria denitrificans]CUJ98405.1 hypothetical protein RUE5091_01919 [Ruegeria denitrificans]